MTHKEEEHYIEVSQRQNVVVVVVEADFEKPSVFMFSANPNTAGSLTLFVMMAKILFETTEVAGKGADVFVIAMLRPNINTVSMTFKSCCKHKYELLFTLAESIDRLCKEMA